VNKALQNAVCTSGHAVRNHTDAQILYEVVVPSPNLRSLQLEGKDLAHMDDIVIFHYDPQHFAVVT
jgi:hypothetical protein